MIRILATDGIGMETAVKLRGLGYELTDQFFEPDDLAEQLKDYDAVIVGAWTKIGKQEIDAALETGRLKVIIFGGVDMDNIDVEYALKNGVEVRNTPNALSAAVAELSIAHLFAIARHIHEANITMREGRWERKAYTGVELAGKTLGLIGFGRVGRCTADKARALGMGVVYYDTMGRARGSDRYKYMEIDDLLARADFISLHIPRCDMAVITAEEIAKMKDGVYIVNCACGGLIDEDDMIAALDSGKIAGVGLDVYPEEPPTNERVLNHPRISLTPHIGASTLEARRRVGDEIVSMVSEEFGF
jgi:D-3-phosphoglycerate dehydrogenase